MLQPYPWQSKQWQSVWTRWEMKTLPHALLLAGPGGSGKLDFAKAIAARLLCSTKHSEAFACGQCQSCLWFEAGSHPDYQIVEPEEEGKSIKVESVRELIASLYQTAQNSSKVVILAPAEAMNKASANALLKLLEEPFGEVIFLLVSHQPGALLPTIRSRCQILSFPVPPSALSLHWLQTQLTSDISPSLLLSLAEKLPLRALALSEKSRWEAYQHWVSCFIQFCQKRLSVLEMAAVCVNTKEDQWVFQALYLWVKDILCLQKMQFDLENSSNAIVHIHYLDSLSWMAKQVHATKIFYFLDELMEVQKQLNLKIPLNKTLLWEGILFRWLNIV